jgi:hypothetical protein
MTPDERTAKSLGGRIGSHTRWSRVNDRAAELAPARTGFRAKLAQQADPHGVLTEAQLEEAVDQLHKAHMARMSLLAAKARAARKARGSAAA